MKIKEREQSGATVFELEGRIDTEGAHQLEDVFREALAAGKHRMALDMVEVEYVSSAGLRTLAHVLIRNREAGGDLKLVGLDPKVLRMLRIIGFDKFFSIYDALEAALGDF